MKILIVDDHPIVRAGVKRLLASEPDIELSDAPTGEKALTAFREVRPDIVILDLNLPGVGGLEVIRRLKAEDGKVRIIVFSMHDDPIYAMRALKEGAFGYVSKNAPPTQIVDAIRRVAEGQTYVGPELAQELAVLNVRAPSSHPLEDLSRRDLEVLRLLGEGRSLQQIADTLGLSYKTVANNCGQIRTKLGVKRTADLIRLAIQNRMIAGS